MDQIVGVHRLAGGLLLVLAVACALLFVDEVVTGITSGAIWKYWAMAVDGLAAFGAGLGARKLLAKRS